MQLGALHPYEQSLTHRVPLHLWHETGRVLPLDIERWLAPANPVDLDALTRAVSPVLDVGCGPGRILAALAEQGLLGLGIDIAPTAVAMVRARGLNCLRRNVFAHLPGERRWATVLLLDGNIGIGGNPERLLARAAALIDPSGRVIVEADPDPAVDVQCLARFITRDEPEGPAFPWAHAGADALSHYAADAGLVVADTWSKTGRTFLLLKQSSAEPVM